MERITIVGFSLAGLRAAETLRREGHRGVITVIGAETHLPYDRPPLSKELLAGDREAADVALRPGGVDDLELDLRLGTRAVALDVAARAVRTDRGEEIVADGVVLATGAAPRSLPGQPELGGIYTLRTLDDALALRAHLVPGARVVVVGAGFIGSEVAATCRGRGLDVTVVEVLEQPLVRGLGPQLGAVLADLHHRHGVDLRLGVGVRSIEGEDVVERVVLDDGTTLVADVVVVGIGVAPVTGWLASSGLALDDGVVCDERCEAAPGIVAAGDLARWPNPRFGGRPMRLEHWTNATEQGVYAARRLLAGEGAFPAFDPVPFVWSDQYDVKVQSVGVLAPDADVEIVHGRTEEHRFVALFGREGSFLGALGCNRPRHVMQYRRLLAEGAGWDAALAIAREATT